MKVPNSASSWEDAFKSAYQRDAEKLEISDKYFQVIRGFVQFTGRLFDEIAFWISPSKQPNHVLIMYRPKYIPRATKMLSVLKQDEGVLTCLTLEDDEEGEDKVFVAKNEQELFNYFSRIIEKNFFHKDMAIMSELNKKDWFEGYIHTKEVYLIDREDIKIEVSRQDVATLAEAPVGIDLARATQSILYSSMLFTLRVPEVDPHVSGYFREWNKGRYLFLEVNGYVCKILDILESEKGLEVQVSKIAELGY